MAPDPNISLQPVPIEKLGHLATWPQGDIFSWTLNELGGEQSPPDENGCGIWEALSRGHG